MKRILVIDPTNSYLDTIKEITDANNFELKWTKKGATGLEMITKHLYDIIFVELNLSDIDGRAVIAKINEMNKDSVIIALTDIKNVAKMSDSLRLGIRDFILKPIDKEKLTTLFDKLMVESTLAKKEAPSFIYESAVMKKLISEVRLIASCQANVFIHGESGSGKEEIAKMIHDLSPRQQNPFIKVNCAAIPDTLVESEFFGHEKGAFTGAHQARLGRFERADTGTLLLDEISEVPFTLQAKLLRIIQEQEFERIGSTESKKVDVRLISTSNRDMLEAIADRHFREDLYYRLNVVPIYIPPLRERKADILPLAEKFLEIAAEKNHRNTKTLSVEARDKLLAYHFPGNVRELMNICERSSIMVSGDIIGSDDIFLQSQTAPKQAEDTANKTLEQIEAIAIVKTLKRYADNKTQAAKALGISVKTLRAKLSKLG
ncbi:MAG: Transcriptional regulatory protein ZraR [Chlamydiia bacterium]|nr:Transcriptional regulatory protein ZraR [Chlamydiia bacterium]MCH9618404.1 Transcriptional regulatory protein ZraR [Chlamydiia bacterium]MCH9624278.1 Transcriptional regulatory protein ZraR [Chlamydiia bacterium]